MSFTDADLIARVISLEDQNAFSELVRRYQSQLRGFFARMTRGDAHLADDLAQETFIKAWKGIASFRGDSRFSTWLFGIGYNEFRSMARKRKDLFLEETTGFEEPSENTSVGSSQLRMDLTEALKVLNLEEKAAVLLCCQNGLTHEEAAAVLGTPLGTVKTNVLRGREKLRRKLSLPDNQKIDA